MPDPRNRATSKAAVIAALLFAVALLARTAAFGRYVTPDEFAWLTWGMRLRAGVLAGDWGATIQTAQPGVTTTWLAALAIQLTTWLQPPAATAALTWAQPLAWLTPDDGAPYQRLALFLPTARWLIASVNALGCVAIFALAHRRWGLWPALVGALALALDPFAAGLGGVLITDALLALACVLTLLLAVPAAGALPGRRAALLAGITTALAALTKLPGVLLVALVPLIWLWPAAWSARAWRAVADRLALWLLALAATLALLLPAVWGAPAHLLAVLRSSGTLEVALTQTVNFLGRPTANPPGALFYPLALALRLSPLATLGLLLAGAQMWRRRRGIKTTGGAFAAWSALFGVLFIAGLSVSTRVFDRYALPVAALLTLLGGIAFGRWAAQRAGTRRQRSALGGGILLAVLFFATSWPTPLFGYNWLLGGAPVAQRALPTGWGEAYSAAARRLAADPTFSGRVLTDNVPAVAPFLRADVRFAGEIAAGDLQGSDAVLLTADGGPAGIWAAIAGRPPAAVASAGTQRVAIYRGVRAADLGIAAPPPVTPDLRGGGVQLLTVAGAQSMARDALLLRATWRADAPTPTAARLVIGIVDDSGLVWATQEWPLVARSGRPAAVWAADEGAQTVDLRLPLPGDWPPATYSVRLSLFDAAGARVGFWHGDGRFAGVQPTLLRLALAQPVVQPPVADLAQPLAAGPLLGVGALPADAETGGPLALAVWWQPASGGDVALTLTVTPTGGSPVALTSISRVAALPAGNRVHLRPTWVLPNDLPAGPAAIALNGVALGTLNVVAAARSFTLPADLAQPLDVQVGTLGHLRAADVRHSDAAWTLRLVWQAAESAPADYTIFVHARAADGTIITQQDRPPAVATSRWVAGQVIVDTFTFAADPALVTFAVGLYDPLDGTRLPLFAADGTPLGDALPVQLAP